VRVFESVIKIPATVRRGWFGFDGYWRSTGLDSSQLGVEARAPDAG
jgi:hypothetical protein